MFNAFISYSPQDHSLVEKIHPTGVADGRSLALEAAGFKVWHEQTRLATHHFGNCLQRWKQFFNFSDQSRQIWFIETQCGGGDA
jgi:hypothetical protein